MFRIVHYTYGKVNKKARSGTVAGKEKRARQRTHLRFTQ